MRGDCCAKGPPCGGLFAIRVWQFVSFWGASANEHACECFARVEGRGVSIEGCGAYQHAYMQHLRPLSRGLERLYGKVLWPCGSGRGTLNVAHLWTLAAREPVTRVYVH